MKIIPTKYRHTTFRSRLEARWAVFFDELGIEWVYEQEGFDLGNTVWYLPDFYLPKFNRGTHVEVKYLGGDFSKSQKFTEVTGKMIWLCEGAPAPKRYKILIKELNGPVVEEYGTPEWDQAIGEDRFFWECEGGMQPEEYQEWNPKYMLAVEKANHHDFNKFIIKP